MRKRTASPSLLPFWRGISICALVAWWALGGLSMKQVGRTVAEFTFGRHDAMLKQEIVALLHRPAASPLVKCSCPVLAKAQIPDTPVRTDPQELVIATREWAICLVVDRELYRPASDDVPAGTRPPPALPPPKLLS